MLHRVGPETSAPPDAEDAAFVGLFADYYATHHVFVSEGEGAVAIERLVRTYGGLKGRKSLFYADTSPREHLHAVRLAGLEISETTVVDSRLGLIAAVRSCLQDLSGPTRLYAAGGAKLLDLLRQMVAEIDEVPCSVLLQRVELGWRNVVCGRCGHEQEHRNERSLTCAGCDASLRVTEFYSVKRAAFLGSPEGRGRTHRAK